MRNVDFWGSESVSIFLRSESVTNTECCVTDHFLHVDHHSFCLKGDLKFETLSIMLYIKIHPCSHKTKPGMFYNQTEEKVPNWFFETVHIGKFAIRRRDQLFPWISHLVVASHIYISYIWATGTCNTHVFSIHPWSLGHHLPARHDHLLVLESPYHRDAGMIRWRYNISSCP